MEFITDFLDGLSGMLEGAWSFLTSTIDNIMMLIEYLGLAVSTCYNLITSLPVWLQASAYVTIAVALLYMILGRSAGGNED